MIKCLMNKDIPVLKIDVDMTNEDLYIESLEVLNNDMLPYELKDYILSTKNADERKSSKDKDVFRDFLSSRMLNLSRDNAKIILNVAALPQNMKISSKLKIAFACKGLTMNDCFWLKDEGEKISFKDVSLRNTRLSEASYIIAILGKHISATFEEIRPDLSTTGMYPKYWKRNNNIVEMWKTDKTSEFINTKAELLCSQILKESNVYAVEYRKEEKDGKTFAVSECISNDEFSYIPAQSIKDWCEHTGQDFLEYVEQNNLTFFANMCIVDYVLFNPDRHHENWGFIIENQTNSIYKFGPLFDHNQALIGDYFKSDINELIYEPTGLTFIETMEAYAPYSDIEWNKELLPKECLDRLNFIENYLEYLNERNDYQR